MDKVRELLKQGLSSKEIKEKYETNLTIGQISSHKAWLTINENRKNEK